MNAKILPIPSPETLLELKNNYEKCPSYSNGKVQGMLEVLKLNK
jgi:hypothetical protein